MKRFLLILALSLAGHAILLHAQMVKPVAFYLKNLPVQRIGEWTDDRIHTDLENKGFIVIDVDCSSFPRTSPALEESLVEFHKGCKNVYAAYENISQKVDINNVLFIPEGYTATMNIPVWNIREHGADGSVEKVMDFWNKYIVGKKKYKDGSSPSALPVRADGSFDPADADLMRNPDGSPVDWWLRMDIIHPSGKAAASVPLLLNFATSGFRFAFANPEGDKQHRWKNVLYWGFLTSGYAFANADHNFKPLARNDTWGYHASYTMDNTNGYASTTAYVRYLKGHLEEYNLNGKIGCTGISKAAYSAMLIANPNNPLFKKKYDKPQPWQGFDCTVNVSYSSSGNGTYYTAQSLGKSRSKDFGENVPMILSAGKKDQYKKWDEFPKLVKVFNEVDAIYLPFWMEELGHTYPCIGIDVATGEKRHMLFKRFFDHYLKPDDGTAADVFLVFPKEGAETDASGLSRILPPDDLLPADMYGVSAYSPICVRFLEEYPLNEISSKVTVTNGGKRVKGTWTISMKGTCFSFSPSKPLSSGKKYKINIPASIKSSSGRHPSADYSREFYVTSM